MVSNFNCVIKSVLALITLAFFFIARERRCNTQWLLVQFVETFLILVTTSATLPNIAYASSVHSSMQLSHSIGFSMKMASSLERISRGISLLLVEDGSGLQNKISSWKIPENSYRTNVIITANPATTVDSSSCNENFVWLIVKTMVSLIPCDKFWIRLRTELFDKGIINWDQIRSSFVGHTFHYFH